MKTTAVIFQQPEHLVLGQLDLAPPGDDDVVVDIEWSGISTGTERLLWTGRMPPSPFFGYPLVPGYESVGRISAVGPGSTLQVGDFVFVPGARCYGEVRGLFGGAADRVVVPAGRVIPLDERLGAQGILLALAATAQHALMAGGSEPPELIIGHGVLGRMLARLAVQAGGSPVVWEPDPTRTAGAAGYRVVNAEDDSRRDYTRICDVSGDANILDSLIGRLAPGGEVVLAGFYSERVSFAYMPAFFREARFRIAAEWGPEDIAAVKILIENGQLSVDGLITHHSAAADAGSAYQTAFTDPHCLKMALHWTH